MSQKEGRQQLRPDFERLDIQGASFLFEHVMAPFAYDRLILAHTETFRAFFPLDPFTAISAYFGIFRDFTEAFGTSFHEVVSFYPRYLYVALSGLEKPEITMFRNGI